MKFRLRTLIFAVTLFAIACTVTVKWLRRPVVLRTMQGNEFHVTGRGALLPCVMTNDAKNLRRLLLLDTYDLDRIGGGGGKWTLLQQAVHHGCVETTTILLQNGADPNVTFGTIPSPLEMAEKLPKPQLAIVLRKHGAK